MAEANSQSESNESDGNCESSPNIEPSAEVVQAVATDRLAAPVDDVAEPRLPFTVVGVGASAGGLEAYTEFLQHCEPNSSMAFVLIQHLSPKHQSILAELLARQTAMPVRQVEDGMAIEPNHVYVIRPGFTMTMKDGRLHLGKSAAEPMHRRPIDDFFKSLAEEQRERSVAVILSGTGSNGTLGCESIKAVGGFVIAEDPQTAKFPSMPRSLVDSNLADAILKPKEMFEAIRNYAGHPYTTGGDLPPEVLALRDRRALGEIIAVLRARTRHDFSVYKKPTLIRRIQRRMSLMQIDKMAEYGRALRQSPGEVTALSDDLMINVTGFFRDPEVWESLKKHVIEPLIAEKAEDSSIRCWVTACSSGEEAYTIGMLLLESAEQAGKRFDIKIFATDTAERSLGQARSGVFPGGIESEVTPDRLFRYFEKEDAHYRVKKELREIVVFAPQNVLQDPPFSRLDICTCRNLLIYIEGETQRRILTMLHFGLRERGTLVLGNSETVTGAEDLFEPIDKQHRIYRRVGQARHGAIDVQIPRAALLRRLAAQLGGETAEQDAPRIPRPSISQLAVKTLLDHYTPAAVVVDGSGEIVHFQGQTKAFLDQPVGEPTRDILMLARQEIRGALRTALQKAVSDNTFVRVRDGTIGEGIDRHRVEITAAPLAGAAESGVYIVTFQHHSDPPPLLPSNGDRAVEVNEELTRVRDELQSTIEELQSSNEEMKASHEEVTSVNEELQSTNEELETSKEELQSLNEELSTVNAQLHAKMEELERTTNDLASLLSSTDIAVIFLDTQFRIRRYTPATRELIELIPSDVGRPLKDLAWKFDDAALMADAQQVLERLAPIERELTGHNGRVYVRRVLPYRTNDNRIDGLVVTFIDITDRKRAEQDLADELGIMTRLHDLTDRLQAIADVPKALGEVLDAAIELLGADRGTIQIRDAEADVLRYAASRGFDSALLATIPPNDRDFHSTCAMAIRTGARVVAGNIPNDPRWAEHASTAAALDYAAAISTPMKTRRESLEGVLTIHFRHPYVPSDRNLRWLDLYARLGAHLVERGRSEIALRESEADYRALTNATHDVVFQMSPDWTEMRRLDGRGFLADLGSPTTSWLQQYVPPDEQPTVRKAIAEATQSQGVFELEHRVLRADGSVGWALSRAVPLLDSNGAITEWFGIATDITSRKQTEAELQAAKEAAEVANGMKDEFLATLSHELRTPLSAILIYAKILQGQTAAQPELSEGISAILRSAEAQRQLIEDLLDTSRITSGKLRLQLQPSALSSIVEQSVHTIRASAEAKGVAVNADLDNVGVVRVDPDRVQQVVWNLLANAVKFTPNGGQVNVSLKRQDREVKIVVRDTGQGISAAFLPHIFEPFRQADASATRSQGGLGLGLAICKRLIEQHGGTITAESAGINHGAVFTIHLPLPVLASHEAAMAKTGGSVAGVRSASSPEFDLAGLNLLLVEDDPETRGAVTALLQETGATVRGVASVEAALEAVRRSWPDLLISDIGMPGEDGYSLIRQVRALEAETKSKRIPAAALTAFARAEDRDRAISAGFDRYISKPVEPTQLLRTVQELAAGDGPER